MTNTPSYHSYIYFAPNTRGASGRAVYIDPALLLPFREYVDPSQASGKLIAQKIGDELRSTAGDLTSASCVGEADRYYKDFSQPNGHGVRVYYRIFQSGSEQNHRGAGVYIEQISPINRRGDGDRPGLHKVKHSQASGGWESTSKSDTVLDENRFMIGALQQQHTYSLGKTIKHIQSSLGNDKSPYNLYYCPEFILDQAAVWESPESRIHHSASADELADILIRSEDAWQSGNHGKYRTEAFGQGAKTLLQALEIVARQGKTLPNHTFSVRSPHVSLAQLRQLIERCQGQLADQWITIIPQTASHMHQEMDAANIIAIQGSTASSQAALRVQQRREELLQAPNTTFFDVFKVSA
ncbi:hypothetical protein KOI40_04900 [Aestuariicella sp. G3-2]|uniref:hypothetical protein n=1 Tax=Pseudomaricurvus albidus TaxID=2842452 RepID=UPI001C0DA146|nr:hypothetical protein [Aestuariicella albida]MBU3069148.1 hypothetical protein [Aestuariicella albida]